MIYILHPDSLTIKLPESKYEMIFQALHHHRISETARRSELSYNYIFTSVCIFRNAIYLGKEPVLQIYSIYFIDISRSICIVRYLIEYFLSTLKVMLLINRKRE